MLYTILLLLMIPFALCAPLRQWSFDKKNNGRLHTDDNMVSLSTMNLMIHDDVQGHYENILDEVISTHSEDVLIQMAHSMNDQQSLEHLLQPQAIALLHHSVQGKSLLQGKKAKRADFFLLSRTVPCSHAWYHRPSSPSPPYKASKLHRARGQHSVTSVPHENHQRPTKDDEPTDKTKHRGRSTGDANLKARRTGTQGGFGPLSV